MPQMWDALLAQLAQQPQGNERGMYDQLMQGPPSDLREYPAMLHPSARDAGIDRGAPMSPDQDRNLMSADRAQTGRVYRYLTPENIASTVPPDGKPSMTPFPGSVPVFPPGSMSPRYVLPGPAETPAQPDLSFKPGSAVPNPPWLENLKKQLGY